MLVFLDESGDPGFSNKAGSSKVFVIACVIFDDELEAEKTAVALKQLRRSLGLSEHSEFKFNKSNRKVKIAFLEAVRPFDFKIRALVVQKRLIKSAILKHDKNSFYSYFIKTVLLHSRGSIREAKIRIDGSGDRIFRRSFLSYLRRELNSRQLNVMKNSKFVDSKENMPIQLADMVAGTIHRYKENEKSDAENYWQLIQSKVVNCWEFQ